MGKLRPREGVGSPQVIQSARVENRLEAHRGVRTLGHRKEPWPPCLQLLYLSFPPSHPRPAPARAPARNITAAGLIRGHSVPASQLVLDSAGAPREVLPLLGASVPPLHERELGPPTGEGASQLGLLSASPITGGPAGPGGPAPPRLVEMPEALQPCSRAAALTAAFPEDSSHSS